jgi:hypothetical protein
VAGRVRLGPTRGGGRGLLARAGVHPAEQRPAAEEAPGPRDAEAPNRPRARVASRKRPAAAPADRSRGLYGATAGPRPETAGMTPTPSPWLLGWVVLGSVTALVVYVVHALQQAALLL